jgi:Predicted nucleotide-binding protein containing TIR-like domain
MQHAFQIIEGTPKPALPILATANDVREVVQLLKKKPEGITIVEASEAIRKRLFDPRKVAAYELWGIISKTGDRLKLSRLGYEFAAMLEPEARIYRAVLDNTPPYRAVLEWIYRRKLELVTYADISQYWTDYFPEALQQGKTSEAQVVSFFHLCHAAEVGMVTVGRKHQPSRLRMDHKELAAHIRGEPHRIAERALAESVQLDALQRAALGPASSPRPQVFISTPKGARIGDSIQDALRLADIDSKVVERDTSGTGLVSERAYSAMLRCDIGIIIVGRADCQHDAVEQGRLKQNVLIEIGAALVHFARRLVLLCGEQMPLPFDLADFCHYDLAEDELTWETGLQLIKTVKLFKTGLQRLDTCGEPARANN